MKTQLILLAIVAILFAACNSKQNQIQSVSGTYISTSSSDVSTADDTLMISQLMDNLFIINHKTGYRAIRNGITFPKRFKKETLNAVYDKEHNVLNETANGRVMLIDPDKRTLQVNKATYHKIN
jgi:predicted nucleic-acid-binding protein